MSNCQPRSPNRLEAHDSSLRLYCQSFGSVVPPGDLRRYWRRSSPNFAAILCLRRLISTPRLSDPAPMKPGIHDQGTRGVRCRRRVGPHQKLPLTATPLVSPLTTVNVTTQFVLVHRRTETLVTAKRCRPLTTGVFHRFHSAWLRACAELVYETMEQLNWRCSITCRAKAKGVPKGNSSTTWWVDSRRSE